MDTVSCASVAEQLKAAGSSSQTSTGAVDTSAVSAASQQSTSPAQSQSSGLHAGMSEAAFKRVVGETPPSADDLEKVHLSHLKFFVAVFASSTLISFVCNRLGEH